ncbi:TraR/DksA family transcriptional regulator [endosymbiont of Ridgeia piscesae]|jgi:RNA polymerase-binding protein DksA|uniref:Transcriptional regulator, TraR/DksA family n=1 Tax=endosymbiont of Ridgeia piscesae TaxID=54398 RepID=A0A0T5Z7I0_9GAMM|nr:TraR/DksA family transcriptional regulator [endosymbiont of Ridgeia piscesae]KRT56569.1 transcriptional regulator, TraR/DksA family [endosymbiont of Ridgeia piscesae]KRT58453.1 transcriptional regulator, TraR/DksA family [endosymbiont of Ridgeia piscesae]
MPAKLTNRQIAEFHQQLRDRYYELREEVRQELLKSDNEQYIDLATRVHDIAEESVADFLVDLNLANIDRHINEIREIDASLIRLAQGNYGKCSDCGKAISEQRLKVNPTSCRCYNCQEIHDKKFAQPGHASL